MLKLLFNKMKISIISRKINGKMFANYDDAIVLSGPSKYSAKAVIFSLSKPNSTVRFAYKHNKILATCFIAILPS